jgi:hypothetical protein
VEEGLDSTEGLVTGQRLEELLKDSVGFDGMSKIGQMTWLTETNGKIADALSYL